MNVSKRPLSRDDKRVKSREHYRPVPVKYLLIGESIPYDRNNNRFFYHKNSNLYYSTLEVFEEIFPDLDDGNFLDRFKEMGFYLEDLCEEPVNQYKGVNEFKKIALRKLYEKELSEKIKEYNPELIIILLKSIAANVQNAQKMVNMSIPFHVLKFLSQKYKEIYITYLKGLLTALKSSGALENE